MKKNVLIIFILIIVFVFSIINVIKTDESGVLFSDNIDDYDSEEYFIPKTVFPNIIPPNAQVVLFTYFDYWNEVRDVYLELKFNTSDEMEDYLMNVKLDCVSNCKNIKPDKIDNIFIKAQNVYNSSFEEVFCTLYSTLQGDDDYTGYKIVEDDGKFRYECNFGLTAYSFDELTVIHTYVYGWYKNDIHNHIPIYFKRFDVPLNESNQRVLFLKENTADGSLCSDES